MHLFGMDYFQPQIWFTVEYFWQQSGIYGTNSKLQTQLFFKLCHIFQNSTSTRDLLADYSKTKLRSRPFSLQMSSMFFLHCSLVNVILLGHIHYTPNQYQEEVSTCAVRQISLAENDLFVLEDF